MKTIGIHLNSIVIKAINRERWKNGQLDCAFSIGVIVGGLWDLISNNYIIIKC